MFVLLVCPQHKMGNKPDEVWIMNRLIKQLTDMGFPVCENIMVYFIFQQIFLLSKILLNTESLSVGKYEDAHTQTVPEKLPLSHRFQRDPAEEALKCNNMNLDQAMSKFPSVLCQSHVHCY